MLPLIKWHPLSSRWNDDDAGRRTKQGAHVLRLMHKVCEKKQVVEFKAKAKQKQSKNEAIVKHSRRIVFKTF